ncbi:MAG: zinc metallopeptidase [Ruminococcus sp.]|nr:zinc metallopeptidase [Ruminococcus sp.]MBR6624284.1 zinc metallopeptidase [Ruminococcus sp.]
MSPIVFFIIMLILPLIAQIMVSSTFNKYKDVRNSRGLTADQVARQILDSNGLYHIRVERIGGNLTDHYDPTANVIRLSDSVYGSTSVAAIGVAAHECGHACQHAEDYAPIRLRTAIVPVTNICSKLWYITFLLGVFLFEAFPALAYLGIIMFAAVVIFQAVTLPTELDASGRALRTLEADGILDYREVPMAKKVLKAAAFTYVAALITSIMQLLRLLAAVRNN